MKSIVASILLLAVLANIEPNIHHSVFYDENVHKLVIVPGKHKNAIVKGIFANTFNSTGWGKLTIQASKDSKLVNFAAGFLEGALTSKHVFQHWYNIRNEMFQGGVVPEEILQFYRDQYEYTWEQIKKNPDCSKWQTVHKIMVYLDGLLKGVNEYADVNESMSLIDILALQSIGDSFELIAKYTMQNSTQQEYNDYVLQNQHCSVLIKADVQSQDVYMGHTAWFLYSSMLRIYKFIHLGDFNIEFSGYPGMTYSMDDFYVIRDKKRKLFVTETTNGVYNKTILNGLTPKSLFTWQRAQLANRLANDGMEWTSYFVFQNSGTYNNQYMVVDNHKIEFSQNGATISPGFLWIIEQLPGDYVAQDVTGTFISNGNYWGSYNIPFSKKVYDVLGTQDMYDQFGDFYSYNNTVRAQIFRRNQTNVHDMESYARVMRYNRYETDPLSNGDPTWAIASRYDLYTNQTKLKYNGAVDCKLTSRNRVLNYGTSLIQNGPTRDDQPVFSWAGITGHSHLGQPEVFDFDWVEYGPDY